MHPSSTSSSWSLVTCTTFHVPQSLHHASMSQPLGHKGACRWSPSRAIIAWRFLRVQKLLEKTSSTGPPFLDFWIPCESTIHILHRFRWLGFEHDKDISVLETVINPSLNLLVVGFFEQLPWNLVLEPIVHHRSPI